MDIEDMFMGLSFLKFLRFSILIFYTNLIENFNFENFVSLPFYHF